MVRESEDRASWELEERNRELEGKLTADVLVRNKLGTRGGELVQEKNEEVEFIDGMEMSKTTTTTKVDINFRFNKNL